MDIPILPISLFQRTRLVWLHASHFLHPRPGVILFAYNDHITWVHRRYISAYPEFLIYIYLYLRYTQRISILVSQNSHAKTIILVKLA